MITCARKSTGQTGTVSSKESHTSSFPTSFEEECPAPSLTYVFSQRASCVVIPWLLRSLQWKKKLNAATDLKGIEQPVPRRFVDRAIRRETRTMSECPGTTYPRSLTMNEEAEKSRSNRLDGRRSDGADPPRRPVARASCAHQGGGRVEPKADAAAG
jgi:hypothetical protein